MVRGRAWTGFEAAALQEAMRYSVRDFAQMLGVELTTVANWRAGLSAVTPRTRTQAILDTAHRQRATPEDRERFTQILAEGEAAWRLRHGHGQREAGTDDPAPMSVAVVSSVAPEVQATDGPSANVRDDGLQDTAQGSLDFARWATDTSADQFSIDSLYFELARIATTYVHKPLRPLLADLTDQRNLAWRLLGDRPRPQQTRDLLVLGGVAITILAHITDDLGDPFAAMQHTLAAERLAYRADHAALTAWIAGTQALITEWSGRPSKAMEFVQRASRNVPPGHQRVRLAALEARAAARAGKVDDARDALRRTRVAIDGTAASDDLQEIGGILTFPIPKAMYYTASALTLIGDHQEAERVALDAINAYETGPAEERSYGDEALARSDVAIARIARHDLDGAVDALTPVLELPAPRRIQSIRDGLAQVEKHLMESRHTTASTAQHLRQEIAAFTPLALQALP